MKNRIIYLLFTTLVIFLTTIFLPILGGKPLLDWHSLGIAISSQQEAAHTPVFTSAGPSKPTMVFRWKDQDNAWHFSQTRPASGTRYETVFIDAERTHATFSAPTPPSKETTQANTPSFPSLYSPAEIARILQEAKDAQKLMQEHQKKLEAAQ